MVGRLPHHHQLLPICHDNFTNFNVNDFTKDFTTIVEIVLEKRITIEHLEEGEVGAKGSAVEIVKDFEPEEAIEYYNLHNGLMIWKVFLLKTTDKKFFFLEKSRDVVDFWRSSCHFG